MITNMLTRIMTSTDTRRYLKVTSLRRCSDGPSRSDTLSEKTWPLSANQRDVTAVTICLQQWSLKEVRCSQTRLKARESLMFRLCFKLKVEFNMSSTCASHKYLRVPKLNHHILTAPAGRHLPSSTVNKMSRDRNNNWCCVHSRWETLKKRRFSWKYKKSVFYHQFAKTIEDILQTFCSKNLRI